MALWTDSKLVKTIRHPAEVSFIHRMTVTTLNAEVFTRVEFTINGKPKCTAYKLSFSAGRVV